MRTIAILLTISACLAIPAFADCGGCGSEGHEHSHAHDHSHKHAASIVDTAAANKEFSTLVGLLKAADLVDTLQGEGPFTVFAPTNAAFAAVPSATLESLKADKQKLAKVLTYHVIPGKVDSSKVIKLKEAKTVEGSTVTIAVQNDAVKIDGAHVTKADIETSNGVIHVIDKVLIPE